MAYGSYAPLYIDAMRSFGNDHMGFRLMWELAAHSDPLGMSYPGHARLAGLIHRADSSIHAKLIELSEMDYIRCHIEPSDYGYKVKLWYQVSPMVIYIRDEFLEEVTAKWERGLPYEHAFEKVNEINSVSNVEQPNRNREKTDIIQQKNQIPNQTTPSSLDGEKPKNRKRTSVNNRQKEGQNHNGTTHATSHQTPANGGTHAVGATLELNPPRAAAPPPFDVPLVNPYDEMAAYKLSIFGGGTRLEQAREAVWRYGEDAIEKAKEQARRKAQTNPIGYVFEALKKGYVKGVIPRQGGNDDSK